MVLLHLVALAVIVLLLNMCYRAGLRTYGVAPVTRPIFKLKFNFVFGCPCKAAASSSRQIVVCLMWVCGNIIVRLLYSEINMRLEVFIREYSGGKDQLTLVNMVTRRHVASLNPYDNHFTSTRIVEAVNLYDDLLKCGLLKPVLAALEKKLNEEQNNTGT